MKRGPLVAAAFIVLIAIGADAAVGYVATTTLTTSAVAPPARFAAGTGATSRFISGFTLSTNGTSFAAVFEEKVGGDVSVKDVADIANMRSTSQTVTLAGSHVSNANVVSFTWTVKNGSMAVATLDMLAASPSATFSLPGSTTYAIDERIKILGGAGQNNASISFSLGLRVS